MQNVLEPNNPPNSGLSEFFANPATNPISYSNNIFIEPLNQFRYTSPMDEAIWSQHSYLKRLPPEAYQGHAVVHWTMTIDQRNKGWLTDLFHAQFREILTHTTFRYQLTCPCFMLMPDHIHFLLMGCNLEASDQRLAIRFLRKRLNWLLAPAGAKLQKQAHDRVLREKSRQKSVFQSVANYIMENPLRARLVDETSLAEYPYSGCIVPGYPELDIWHDGFWDSYWKLYRKLQEAT